MSFRPHRRRADLLPALFLMTSMAAGCDSPPAPSTSIDDATSLAAMKSSALVRAERRLFDGAPPVIPHEPLGASCIGCHNERGMAVQGLGIAPPSPHGNTPGMSAESRCEQCHVFSLPGTGNDDTDDVFVVNFFQGLAQDLRRGTRLYEDAPPTIPHHLWMRDNCAACHTGPATREDIRTDHPERVHCQQCHAADLLPKQTFPSS